MKFWLTKKGTELLAQVNAGQGTFHLTRAVTGAGNTDHPELLPDVLEEKQRLQIEEVQADGEYTQIVCVLTNLEWTEEYVLRQIGLFASDANGQEQLVIVGQDPYGDRIPSIQEKEVEYQYHIGMTVTNADQVTFDFSFNDFLRKKYFYEHLAEFDDYKEEIQKQFSDLPRVRIGPPDLLDRKDTILFETGAKDRVIKIRQRDERDQSHTWEFASLFSTAETRELPQSGETLSVLFGKIRKWLDDLKPNTFREADDPFVMMRESTYIQPQKRTKGSLYGLVTKERNVLMMFFSRYVQGLEDLKKELTLYGVETTEPTLTDGEKSERAAKAIIYNFVQLPEAGDVEKRQQYTLYGRITLKKGE